MVDQGEPSTSTREDGYDYRTSSLEDDRRRAREVWDRAERRRSERQAKGRGKGAGQRPRGGEDDGTARGADHERAARRIQQRYRSHVGRRTADGRNLTCSQRWEDGMRQRKLSAAGREQNDGKNDAMSRWHRSGVYAEKISEGASAAAGQKQDGELTEEEEMQQLGREYALIPEWLGRKNAKEKERIRKERVETKQMDVRLIKWELQYWLEMVDKKHRYGSNLKYYHQKWNEEETSDNFFHWLDDGDGKDLDLEQCPRSRLEKERITYLTAEQRETYRVTVNSSGLLVWAKDGSLLDTSKFHDDRGPEHGGVVSISEEEYKKKKAGEKEKIRRAKENGGETPSSSDYEDNSSSSSSSDSEVADEIREGVKPYADKGGTAGQGKGVKQFKQRLQYYTSPRAVVDRLLRQTINKNTWLYVADLKNNLYVGIKKTGGFQHSSFLYGARAHEGKLTSLSPLSGHYRAGTMHFKAFVRSLEEGGVDMSSVSISKSVMTIRGIEKYGRFSKKKAALVSKIKTTLTQSEPPEEKDAERSAEEVQKIQNEEEDEGQDGHAREVQRGANEMREENGEEGPLPGEGKKVQEMTDEERLERGVALLQMALERGLSVRGREHEDDEHDEENARGREGEQA
ncbi:SPOSA6832_00788 [Sporobolomyces salmonicolor]|uniref:SPOSA6832_00788-mRNA-1:cds n=1 Tax=Sporidiobolus salmonicolor TaxID=5005 RepID=A0A0D6EI80_SPOSA|nr:SPOSA6832_00788 [Sporobolomyces salmonicolor]